MPKLATLKPRVQTQDSKTVATFTDTERIRGTTLQNIRRKHFERYPLCVRCLAATPERTRLATELDHITPLHLGGKDAPSNRQGLCTTCHNEKTITERGDIYTCDRTKRPGGR